MSTHPIPGNLNHDPGRRREVLMKRATHIHEEITILQDRLAIIRQEINADS